MSLAEYKSIVTKTNKVKEEIDHISASHSKADGVYAAIFFRICVPNHHSHKEGDAALLSPYILEAIKKNIILIINDAKTICAQELKVAAIKAEKEAREVLEELNK